MLSLATAAWLVGAEISDGQETKMVRGIGLGATPKEVVAKWGKPTAHVREKGLMYYEALDGTELLAGFDSSDCLYQVSVLWSEPTSSFAFWVADNNAEVCGTTDRGDLLRWFGESGDESTDLKLSGRSFFVSFKEGRVLSASLEKQF